MFIFNKLLKLVSSDHGDILLKIYSNNYVKYGTCKY